MAQGFKYQYIVATFIGKTNSLGYVTGQRYRLRLLSYKGMQINRVDGTKNGSGLCPYESLSAFIRNWDDIKHYEPFKSK